MSKKTYEKETELNSIIRYNKTKEFSSYPQEKHYTSLVVNGQKNRENEFPSDRSNMADMRGKHNNIFV